MTETTRDILNRRCGRDPAMERELAKLLTFLEGRQHMACLSHTKQQMSDRGGAR